jgi:hypothetical protein
MNQAAPPADDDIATQDAGGDRSLKLRVRQNYLRRVP